MRGWSLAPFRPSLDRLGGAWCWEGWGGSVGECRGGDDLLGAPALACRQPQGPTRWGLKQAGFSPPRHPRPFSERPFPTFCCRSQPALTSQ